jgi:hypothetical protein
MILVDDVTQHETTLRHKKWSHMVSTVSPEELHAMADKLGLKRSWFQSGSFDHYDITPPKRALALKLGAVGVSARILLFGNYDYARRRPTCIVPEPYASELAKLREAA